MQANLRLNRTVQRGAHPAAQAGAFLADLPVFSIVGAGDCRPLFWLQVVRHKEFVERAQKQQQRTFEVAPAAACSTTATCANWP